MSIPRARQQKSAAALHAWLAVVVAIVSVLKEDHAPDGSHRRRVRGAGEVRPVFGAGTHQDIASEGPRQAEAGIGGRASGTACAGPVGRGPWPRVENCTATHAAGA